MVPGGWITMDLCGSLTSPLQKLGFLETTTGWIGAIWCQEGESY